MRTYIAILIFSMIGFGSIGVNAQDASSTPGSATETTKETSTEAPATNAADAKEASESETNAENATIDSPSAASLYNTGLGKAKAKEYAEALDLFKQAIAAANPDEEKGAKIIRLSKKNGTRAAYGMGTQLRKAKNYEAALVAFETGIGYSPDNYSNYKGKAQCQEGMGQKAEAISTYMKAAELATAAEKADKAASMVKKAQNIVAVTKGKKKYDEAIAYAEAYLAIAESPEVHYNYAASLLGKGDATKAIEHVDIAIATSESADKDKYYMTKAEAHEKLGQKSSAVKAYKMVTGNKYSELAQYKVGQLGG